MTDTQRLIATERVTSPLAALKPLGTALKPAFEPIVVARKPLAGTVVENVLEHGTGALNIDACRIGVSDAAYARNHSGDRGHGGTRRSGEATSLRPGGGSADTDGRWPANVVLSEQAAEELDAQSGEQRDGLAVKRNGVSSNGVTGWGKAPPGTPDVGYGGGGGASRFFYCAKTSRAERNAGLEGFEERMPDNAVDRAAQREGREGASGRGSRSTPRANVHPTVKPINLMRWLLRLVTPPGGLVLDPFLGSGSTGCAAALEGFAFVGIEREPEYIEIAQARIAFWSQHEGREVEDVLGIAAASERQSKAAVEAGQTSLLEAA